MSVYDAVVVGSGPNGLSAAVTLAREGMRVLVREGQASLGGGVRSGPQTAPGFIHDHCAAVYPLGAGSPFFRTLPLGEHGLQWLHGAAPLAHPFDDGSAVLLEHSVAETASGLGRDAAAYRRLISPLVDDWDALSREVLAPVHWPRAPLTLARFGLRALGSCEALVTRSFAGERARALLAGICAHAALPLDALPTGGVGLLLAAAGHAVGWPIPRGGAQSMTDALASLLRSYGGALETGAPVRSLDELPPAQLILLDLTPQQVLVVAGARLPARYRQRLAQFRYGPGAYKMDWALSGPIPWTAQECGRALTVHVSGTFEEIRAAEAAPPRGDVAERPSVILVQPTLRDPSRAPAGRHVAWAYCHVPNGSTVDMSERIERQIERFAPGFRELVLARAILTPHDLERSNANLVGGDINGGANVLGQILFRPASLFSPYATPSPRLFLCSSSTPPGVGAHGMCGHHAARAALGSLR